MYGKMINHSIINYINNIVKFVNLCVQTQRVMKRLKHLLPKTYGPSKLDNGSRL